MGKIRLAVFAGMAAGVCLGNPLELRGRRVRVEAEFADGAAAEAARMEIAPLRGGAEFAFATRWDDTDGRHGAKAEMLKRAGVRGTFYLVGNAERWAKEHYAKVRAAECAVGNHTATHRMLGGLTPNAAFREIVKERVALECAAGQTVASFVFPGNTALNGYDETAGELIGRILAASGHYVLGSSAGKRPLGQEPAALQAAGRYFGANDREPDAAAFRREFAKAREFAAGEAGRDFPLVVFGTHSWCGEEGNAVQEGFLREAGSGAGVWKVNDLEYAAYRYGHHFGGARKVGAEGRRARFEYEEFAPGAFGWKSGATLSFGGGAEPVAVTVDGRAAVKCGRGTWNAGETGRVEMEIGRDGLGAVKFSARLARGAGGAELRWRLENGGGEALREASVTAIVPPKWGRMRRVAHLEDVAAGEVREGAMALGEETGGEAYAEGDAHYAAGADYVAGGKAKRIWSEFEEEGKPAGAEAGFARGNTVVWGPAPWSDAGEREVGGEAEGWRVCVAAEAAYFRAADFGRKEFEGLDAGVGSNEVYAAMEVAAPAAGRYRMRFFSRSAKAARLWVGGEEVGVRHPHNWAHANVDLDLREGANLVVMKFALPGRARGFDLCWGVFDGEVGRRLKCMRPTGWVD